VRRVSRGIITTVVGSGTGHGYKQGAFGGDGGAATAALFNTIESIVLHPLTGDLYIADRFNHRIRAVSTATGNVSTVAGSGVAGFADGPSASAQFNEPTGLSWATGIGGRLIHLVADYQNDRVRALDLATATVSTVAGNGVHGHAGDGGAAEDAALCHPQGLASDAASGHVWVAELCGSVRELSPAW